MTLESTDIEPPIDWFLQILLGLVNDRGFQIPVILSSGGLLVSGRLIGGRDYFRQFGQQFAEGVGGDDEITRAYEDIFSKMGESLYEPSSGAPLPDESQHSDEGSEEKPDPYYVHLADARFFHPGGPPLPSNRAICWRTRLEAIEGFCLGQLGPPEEEPD